MKERDHKFVECSTYADDIVEQRRAKGAYQRAWHYVGIPLFDDPDAKPEDLDYLKPEHDMIGAIKAIVKWINKEKDYTKSFYYKGIMAATRSGKETDGLSVALRLLIHYLVDLHQPLHTTTRVNYAYPAGDRYGELFRLSREDESKTLHQAWEDFPM